MRGAAQGMRRPGRSGAALGWGVRIGAFLVALAVGVVGGTWAGLWTRGAPSVSLGSVTTRNAPALPATRPVAEDTILAWTPNGLPRGFAARVSRLRGVAHAVPVVSGIAWLTETMRDLVPQRPPQGYAYPIEVAAARLGRYAPFLAPGDRLMLPEVRRGGGLLGRSSAALRGIEPGETAAMWFRPGGVWGGSSPRAAGVGGVPASGPPNGRRIGSIVRIPVAGIVPDAAIGANEVFVSMRTAARLGLHTERYILVDPEKGTPRGRLAERVRGLLPGDVPMRIRGPGETPYFRQGDAVLPQVRMKQLFGEFAARPEPGGYLAIDPEWISRHIVTTRLPLLGEVRCNRTIIPQLRGALSEIEASGLGHLVNPRQFGGCFSPRFVNRIPNAGLSHHAWGAAVDINVAANPYGRPPTQDHRLVAIFERWGFIWGGRFLIPDGMHFDFIRFASGS